MSRRLLSVAFGVTLGVLATRRAAALAQRMPPGALARRLILEAGEFVADVRVAMGEREQELRSGLGLGVDVAALEPARADSSAQRLGG